MLRLAARSCTRRRPSLQDQVGEDLLDDRPIEDGGDALELGVGAGFGVGDKAGRVLMHRAVQRGLLGAVTLVVDRGAARRPLGLPADGLNARLPKW